MILTRLRTLLLILILPIVLMGATTITTITSRPTDVDCTLMGTDGTVWYNTTTSLMRKCQGGTAVTITIGVSSGGSSIILDLGNNGSIESAALGKISTTGDIHGIFQELFTDQLLIDLSLAWPKADALAANGSNCPAGQFPLGVSATGVAESCTPLPTTITGTTDQIVVSASTGAVVISLPNNLSLPGTTTGTFSGPLTGPVTGNASTATALANNGGNCSPGNAPLGVDALGTAEGCFSVSTPADLAAHLNDTTNAHMAPDIGFNPHGSIGATNVQGAIQEVRDEAPRKGGASDCALGEIYKTVAGPIWDCATDASSGGGGSPGGANLQVQVNNAGAFAGFPDFTRNASTGVITANGFSGPLTGNVTGNLTGTASDLACTSCVTIGELTFDPATQAELDAHTGLTTAHGSTAANTASTIVQRDASGNFAAGTITAALNGNASTASALGANGANCSAGQFPLGVNASGAVENCTPLPTTISGTANQITVSASTGPITLSIPANANLPGTITGTYAFTPVGGIAATNIAAGLAEVDAEAEKLANKNLTYMGLTLGGKSPWNRNDEAVAHTDLSATSQIDAATAQKSEIGIQNSGAGNVTLTTGNPRITGCTLGNDGVRLLIYGLSTTKTVTIPTGQGVLLAGNTGSVIIGIPTSTPPSGSSAEFRCNGSTTTWEQISYVSLQQAKNAGAVIGNAVDEASGVIIGNVASGTYCVKFGATEKCYVSSAVSDNIVQLSAGKSLLVKKSDGSTLASLANDTGASTGFGTTVERYVMVGRNATLTIAAGATDFPIPLNTEACLGCEDTTGMHESVTNPSRITFNTGGKYMVQCSLRVHQDTNTLGGTLPLFDSYIRLNGTTALAGAQRFEPQSPAIYFNPNVIRTFAANDYVELAVTWTGASDTSLDFGDGRFTVCSAYQLH